MPTTTLDGRTLAWDEAGGGEAPPLLLVHGFAGGRDDFAGVLGALGEDRRVVAVDLPGHGGSEGWDDPSAYGLGALAAWVVTVADALELGAPHLLGHSLGGLVVQRTAALASQRLASLVLMSTGLGALREDRHDHIVGIAVAARDEGPEAALARALDGEVVPPDEHARFLARYRAIVPAAFVGGARGLLGAAPLGAFLRGIDIPVLVVHGADDRAWLPNEQRLLVATVQGAEHAVVPDAAHSPQRENPAVWTAVVRDFLARADARGGGVPPRRRRRGAAG